MNKKCGRCKEIKPIDDFYRAKAGHSSICKECTKRSAMEWRANNHQIAKAKQKSYRLKNKEEIRARRKRYYEANKEKIIAKMKAWINNNREKHYARARRWGKENVDKRRVYLRNRRSRVVGELSVGIVQKLYEMQKGRCPCCKQPLGDEYHIDHIIPISMGGPNTDDNVQLLKAECNLRKGAKHPIAYMQSKGMLL